MVKVVAASVLGLLSFSLATVSGITGPDGHGASLPRSWAGDYRGGEVEPRSHCDPAYRCTSPVFTPDCSTLTNAECVFDTDINGYYEGEEPRPGTWKECVSCEADHGCDHPESQSVCRVRHYCVMNYEEERCEFH